MNEIDRLPTRQRNEVYAHLGMTPGAYVDLWDGRAIIAHPMHKPIVVERNGKTWVIEVGAGPSNVWMTFSG